MPVEAPEKPAETAPEPVLETRDINDVEIWSAGEFNGDKYDESDLDEMVRASSEVQGLKPYLKLGHDNTQALLQKDGYPSAGWVTNLRRTGSKLYADFKSIPKTVAALIDAKAYGRLSPEIFWNLKAKGGTYRRALKAVALLGADVPANLTLKDFAGLYTGNFDAVKAYHNDEVTMDAEKEKQYKDELESLRTAKAEAEKQLAEARAREYTAKVESTYAELKDYMVPASRIHYDKLCALMTGVRSYTAGGTVYDLSDPLAVVKDFVQSMPKINVEGPVTRHFDVDDLKINADQSDTSDSALHEKVVKYRETHSGVSYTDAVKAVSGGFRK